MFGSEQRRLNHLRDDQPRHHNKNQCTWKIGAGAPIPGLLSEFMPASMLDQIEREVKAAKGDAEFQEVIAKYVNKHGWPSNAFKGTEIPHRETFIECIFGSLEHFGIRTGYQVKNLRGIHVNINLMKKYFNNFVPVVYTPPAIPIATVVSVNPLTENVVN